jgi:hypothetical protein
MREVKIERTYRRARIYAKTLRWSLGFLTVAVLFLILNPDWSNTFIDWLDTLFHPLDCREGGGCALGGPSILSIIMSVAPLLTVLISFFTLVVSAIGTTSTILLGWRAERRQSEEFKLKIKQLELQLQETQAKLVSPAKDIST